MDWSCFFGNGNGLVMVLELIIVIDNSSILFFFQSSALSISRSSYSLFIHLPSIGMGGPDEEDHSGEKGEGGVEDSCIKIIMKIVIILMIFVMVLIIYLS